MAKVCKCHINRRNAVAKGMDFHEAVRKYGKPYYHEHRCECGCGCKTDTLGYLKCVSCDFGDCRKTEQKKV